MDKIKLSELSFSELFSIKSVLIEIINKNNYHGGDQELKNTSNNTIIKIDEEIIRRIKNIE